MRVWTKEAVVTKRLSSLEIDSMIKVQILKSVISVSVHINALGKTQVFLPTRLWINTRTD